MDQLRIDSHKLFYHPKRISHWMDGKDIYPIYMEISPTSACNHRCVFCSLDFVGYKHRYLKTDRLKTAIGELAELGLKSIMFAGEGEPLLHRDFTEIVVHTRASGIDVAVTTNGVHLTPQVSDVVLKNAEWIKISCNAGSPETYAKIHRTHASDFQTVIRNLRYAANIKKERGYCCVIGLQILLLPENECEVEALGRMSRDMKLDYMVVKPYSQHPGSRTRKYENIRYEKCTYLAEKLESLNTESFHVIFRHHTMEKWNNQNKSYNRCLALPFWSYLDAGGNIWGCSVYLQDDRFLYGNIYEQCFKDIWEGPRRRKSMAFVEKDLDAASCRINCRMDAVNQYLWELKHPPLHVNFI